MGGFKFATPARKLSFHIAKRLWPLYLPDICLTFDALRVKTDNFIAVILNSLSRCQKQQSRRHIKLFFKFHISILKYLLRFEGFLGKFINTAVLCYLTSIDMYALAYTVNAWRNYHLIMRQWYTRWKAEQPLFIVLNRPFYTPLSV